MGWIGTYGFAGSAVKLLRWPFVKIRSITGMSTGIMSLPEIVDRVTNVLSPLSGCVREEREVCTRFARLGRFAGRGGGPRMSLKYGNVPRKGVAVFWVDRVHEKL
jgi:hypothetical protein